MSRSPHRLRRDRPLPPAPWCWPQSICVRLPNSGTKSRGRCGRREIVLQVSCDRYTILRRARQQVPLAILLALDQNLVRPPQNVLEKPAPPPVPGQSAIGNPAVDDQKARSRALRFAVQIRPDFGLEHDHHRRAEPPQDTPDHRPIVEGGVEDAIGEPYQALIGDLASGQRRDGHEDLGVRLDTSHAPDQFDGREHLAHGNRVKPDGTGTRRLKGRRQEPEPFLQPVEIPRIAQSSIE